MVTLDIDHNFYFLYFKYSLKSILYFKYSLKSILYFKYVQDTVFVFCILNTLKVKCLYLFFKYKQNVFDLTLNLCNNLYILIKHGKTSV